MRAIPPIIRTDERLILIVGAFGSGKSECSVNLALLAAGAGRRVRLADLDVVNPYFRSREARRAMEREGVEVIVPPPSLAGADLPIVPPEVLGLFRPKGQELSIFDIGGNEVGARVLGSLRGSIGAEPAEVWQVVNPRRPYTADAEGCRLMRGTLERAARLPVTGLIVNAHLLDETTEETILDGVRVAGEIGLPIRAVAAMEPLCDAEALADLPFPILRMRRHLAPPWHREPGTAALAHPSGRHHGPH